MFPLLATLRGGDLWYRKGTEKTHVEIAGGFADIYCEFENPKHYRPAVSSFREDNARRPAADAVR